MEGLETAIRASQHIPIAIRWTEDRDVCPAVVVIITGNRDVAANSEVSGLKLAV